MKSQPFFSIITVSYNAEKYIRRTIDSTLYQDFEDYEIIVKDGLSEDDTLIQIPQDHRIKVYSTADTGIYNAMNQAVSNSVGKYLIFMNCGDIFNSNDVLDKVHNFIINEDKYSSGIVIGDCYSKNLYKCQNGCEKRFKQYRCSGFAHQAMFIRSDVFSDLGLYDETYLVNADFELFMRSHKAGKGIGYIPYPICDYMGGGFSARKKTKKLLDNDKKRIRKKYFTCNERIRFFIMFHATFPRLRNYIESDAAPRRLTKAYRGFTNIVNRQRVHEYDNILDENLDQNYWS